MEGADSTFTKLHSKITPVVSPRTSTVKLGLLHRKIVAPIGALLTQGITPEKIAMSLAFGIALGVFPVLGSTTVLCLTAAAIFRLNLPAIQLVNWLVYPLQAILLLPFIRLGEKLFRAAPLPLSLPQILALARSDWQRAFRVLWLAEAHAVLAWLLIGPLTILILHFLLSKVLRRAAAASRGSDCPTANAL